MAARRSSGSGASSRSDRVMASAHTTPQPPAVVMTAVRGPVRQRLGGEGGGRLEGVLHAGRPGDARLAAGPVEDPVVGGQRPGVAGRRGLASRGGAALEQHEGLAPGGRGDAAGEGGAVGHPLDVGEAHRGGRVVGEVLEVVGHVDGGGVAGAHRPADADAGGHGQVLEAGHEVARLAGHPDAPGRRVGGHDLGAQRRRGGHHALAVGAGQQHAQLVAEGHQVGLGRLAVGPGLAVAGRGDEGGPDALGRRGPQQVGVGRRPGCTRRPGRPRPSGTSSTVGHRLDARAPRRRRGWWRTPAPS